MSDKMETLVKSAQNKEYSNFADQARDTLLRKVHDKLEDRGYFDRLNQAKGLDEDFEKEKRRRDSQRR